MFLSYVLRKGLALNSTFARYSNFSKKTTFQNSILAFNVLREEQITKTSLFGQAESLFHTINEQSKQFVAMGKNGGLNYPACRCEVITDRNVY